MDEEIRVVFIKAKRLQIKETAFGITRRVIFAFCTLSSLAMLESATPISTHTNYIKPVVELRKILEKVCLRNAFLVKPPLLSSWRAA